MEKSTSVVEVMGSGSSIQGVAWTATLQSLHVPISVSFAATCGESVRGHEASGGHVTARGPRGAAPYLDDVLLPSVGVGDGVGGAVGQLHLQAAQRTTGP